MKLAILLALIAFALHEVTAGEVAAWKIGDRVSPSDLVDGVIHEGATLSRVDPDGITITHDEGIAKIPFEKLTPEAQAKFGYDPAKEIDYTKEREYLEEIARLRAEVVDLRGRLSAAHVAASPESKSQAPSRPPPTQAGFNAFVEEQRNLSGSRKILGSSHKSGARYTQGPWRGKTADEGMESAIQQWERMPYEKKIAYERRAESYGSMEQYRPPSTSSSSSNPLAGKQFIKSGNRWMSTDGSVRFVIDGTRLRFE